MSPVIKKIAQITLFFGIFFPFFSFATPELFITWKADSYTPNEYGGKSMPTAGTPITAMVLLIDNGKVINLAPYIINWYADEEQVFGGTGKTAVQLRAPETGQDTFEVRVNIGKYNDQPLDAFATIPIVRPKIVIRPKEGAQQRFSAIPYFWNIKKPQEVRITWTDNGDSITAYGRHLYNQLEFAQATIIKTKP